jgi:ribosomal-protein-alanine N-acetyltransferase
MVTADLPAVLAIERASYPTPWTEDNFRHEIEANPHAWNLVVDGAHGIAGYACCYLVAGELQINDIAVHPEARRRGLGGWLLDEILERAARRGARRATLEVRPSNAAARALYASRGFAVSGRRSGYYADSGEDAILMDRSLRP